MIWKTTALAAASSALFTLSGCYADTPPPETQMPGPPSAEAGCGAEQLDAYVGTKATDDVIATLQEWRGEKQIRVLKPGSAMTMDYRPDRLNVMLDDEGTITKFQCN